MLFAKTGGFYALMSPQGGLITQVLIKCITAFGNMQWLTYVLISN